MRPRAIHPALATGLAAALAAAAPAPAASASEGGWRAPVPGEVTRPFDLGANPYEGGRHRGVDLAAPPGAAVRAPCAGRVAVAGRVGTSGRVVTVVCGRWRVSHLPLAAVAVRSGEVVGRGAPLGTVAASREHDGLHLGVRRDGARFGYADPLGFLSGRGAAPPPLAAPRARRGPSRPRPAPRLVRPTPPRRAAALRGERARGRTAPWPAWAGLALVVAGLGLRWSGRGERERPAPAPAALAEASRSSR